MQISRIRLSCDFRLGRDELMPHRAGNFADNDGSQVTRLFSFPARCLQSPWEACQPLASVASLADAGFNSHQQIKPRSIGAEHVALEALKELHIPQLLEENGFNARQRAQALGNIIARMCAPRSTKERDAISQRLGRLKEKCKRVSAHYEIFMEVDETTGLVTQLTWQYSPQQKSKQTHPGAYQLRTTLTDWDNEALWRTYTMLTDLEAVFRSLKSELGMRPVYHQLETRCDGHFFITVLAYQAVQLIRKKPILVSLRRKPLISMGYFVVFGE